MDAISQGSVVTSLKEQIVSVHHSWVRGYSEP